MHRDGTFKLAVLLRGAGDEPTTGMSVRRPLALHSLSLPLSLSASGTAVSPRLGVTLSMLPGESEPASPGRASGFKSRWY